MRGWFPGYPATTSPPTYDHDWSWALRELDGGRPVQRPLPSGDTRRLEPTSREAPSVADLTSKQWGQGTGTPP